ncbi:fibrobacter succinogenes major paralogous domain-containing protein [Fibrobacter sp. UWB7]|uniref:fibrobacter succinogenes major paralogous domain-containing protein n=1 Tax=Fibrobacter sp. UWB7 TaxID=1896206 RepID=UPI00091E581F|nr:fibrobacter succinogenes major paralogous domain-containing protein [Fibrobacter sp. UWB7]SHM46881.1 major paralogous domain-containing protein [Fibrobacter sp. UWB7]
MRNFKYSIIASIILSVALAACGGDSGTSPSDVIQDSVPGSPSSSSVKKSSSSSVIRSSSSVIQSGDSHEGSSNSKRSSSSSSKVSSSSAKATSSSSSAKIVSSSSKRSEGDPSSSSQKIVSSSSVAPASSSSKKVESSSSEYVPFDHSKTHAADWEIGENRYKTFVDPRNGRSYYYITIPGRVFKEMGANGKAIWTEDTVTVMAENLNIGKMVLGENDQNDDGEIERYCYNNDTTYCDEFGGLYQWAEMMQLPSRCNTESCAELIQENHRGICPEGWRLMTYDDYKIIENADGNEEHGIAGLRSGYRFSGYNTTGFSLVGAGKREKNGKFSRLEEVAYWFYPLEDDYDRSIYAHFAYIAMSGAYGVGADNGDEKTYGLSVRCVKLE